MNQSQISEYLQQSAQAKLELAKDTSQVELVASKLIEVAKRGGRFYACGNGGSCCDSLHFVEELVARFRRERPGIAAHHLLDAGTMTCWGNDYDFKSVFERQVKTFATKNDALIVFSTSGNSDNVIAALKAAREIGSLCVGMLGKDGGKSLELTDCSIVVPSDETSIIQEVHSSLIHILCEALETTLFPEA